MKYILDKTRQNKIKTGQICRAATRQNISFEMIISSQRQENDGDKARDKTRDKAETAKAKTKLTDKIKFKTG
jgi:hypothetical protein